MSEDLETVERLTRYLDGDLTPDEVEQVEVSLRKDRHMRDLLRELSTPDCDR